MSEDHIASTLERLFGIAGKHVLVTGGGQGIGRMIAEGFVAAGATVHIASRKVDVCRQTAAELSASGTCVAHAADLSSEEGCCQLAEAIGAVAPRLHVLVNNAGANWAAPFEQYPDAAWDRVMNLNVRAAFNLTRALVPRLEAAAGPEDPARVINVGSIDGLRVPHLDTFAYAASKAALHHLTRVLARTLGERGITVNAIAPGPFSSRMMRETLARMGDQLAAMSPLGRIGRPDDLAGTGLFLASRAGSYLTGAVIPVDGGIATTR